MSPRACPVQGTRRSTRNIQTASATTATFSNSAMVMRRCPSRQASMVVQSRFWRTSPTIQLFLDPSKTPRSRRHLRDHFCEDQVGIRRAEDPILSAFLQHIFGAYHEADLRRYGSCKHDEARATRLQSLQSFVKLLRGRWHFYGLMCSSLSVLPSISPEEEAE